MINSLFSIRFNVGSLGSVITACFKTVLTVEGLMKLRKGHIEKHKLIFPGINYIVLVVN